MSLPKSPSELVKRIRVVKPSGYWSLGIPLVAQYDSYSCMACCYVMLVKYFTGEEISRQQARKDLGTDKDGTSPEEFLKALRKRGIYRQKIKRSAAVIRNRLSNGWPVYLDDDQNFAHAHAVLLDAYSERPFRFRVRDPLWRFPYWMNQYDVINWGEEAFCFFTKE